MFVENVKLMNFRNYEYGNVSFKPGANFIYGNNASGKTNVVESIYLAATTKSHRFSKDKEIDLLRKEIIEKEAELDELIAQLANELVDENTEFLGEEVVEVAKEKIQIQPIFITK